MRKIIYDCDNTFGLKNHDVDDGLTLFYLLGMLEIDLLGVTLSYGNGTILEVQQMTQKLQSRLQLDFSYYPTEKAVDFLVEQVNRFPNEITIIATGALTNLARAQEKDPAFFNKVQEVILMGGITQPLFVNQRPVTELNFSCDSLATEKVLLSQAKLTIMNGHMTAEAFFSKKELEDFLEAAGSLITSDKLRWIADSLQSWIEWNEEIFHFSGFCNWDMTTAVYLERPDLFSQEEYQLAPQQAYLSKGQLTLAQQSDYLVKMPQKLLDLTSFNQLVIQRMVQGLTRSID
ncbi:MAG: nucleoside hydrolase [Enterococcus devriesei]|uniref:nucleoside hydrolase n=1 Tax=Enterococcus devriesei TaxID=319970 RepID=UPI003F8E8985